jgi:hypothetical protein
MSVLQIFLLFYGGATVLATLIVYSACVAAQKGDQALLRHEQPGLSQQPVVGLRPEPVLATRRVRAVRRQGRY